MISIRSLNQSLNRGPVTPLEGEDETGRNFATDAFSKVEKTILDSYNMLSNEEDQSFFYDYLITNLKLYFDKFEDELQLAYQSQRRTNMRQKLKRMMLRTKLVTLVVKMI